MVRAAVLRDDAILMVRVRLPGRELWTLPGGGVEANESDEEAVCRELAEETHLVGQVVRYLCNVPDACYLVDVGRDADPKLDMNPELPDANEIVEVAWRPLAEVAGDLHVSQVLNALGL